MTTADTRCPYRTAEAFSHYTQKELQSYKRQLHSHLNEET